MSKFGQHLATTQADLTNTGMWVRVTSAPVVASTVVTGSITQNVSLHSWEAIYWNDGLKKWQSSPSAYGNASISNNTTSDYDAIIASDLGNLTRTTDGSLTNNTTAQSGVTPYFAVRDPVSRRLIAVNPNGGGGNFNATSTETAIMLLGTYDQYKDCPNVPPKAPTTITDLCNGTRGTELCVPAYAYAVYQRCGYVWNKIGDTRTYQVWANEMNGGTGSLRRMHVPRWGGNLTASGPDPDSECMGLAFLGYSSQGSLTCGCPPCLSSPPPGVKLCVKFRTASRPSVYNECGSTVLLFDENDLWDKDIQFEISTLGCTGGGNSGEGIPIFDFQYEYQDGSLLECDWGPDVFDPCDPCAHFGRIAATISISDDNNVNCGSAGHWKGEFKARDFCNLMCDCGSGPVKPSVTSMCNGCGNNIPPIFYFILPETVEIVCCPSDLIYGGTATSSPPSGYAAGNSTTSNDIILGGGA